MPVAPGKTLLKTAGIFYAIAGAFSFVSGITFIIPAIGVIPDDILRMTMDDFFMIGDYLAIGGFLALRDMLGIPANFVLVFIVAVSLLLLYMGLATVKYCDYLKKAKRLMVFGIINLAVMALHVVLSFSFGAVVGVGIACMHFWGAYQNNEEHKKGAADGGESSG